MCVTIEHLREILQDHDQGNFFKKLGQKCIAPFKNFLAATAK